MKFTSTVLAALVATSLVVALHAQVKERPIPRIVKKDGRFALLVDGAPYLMLGAQVHNSSTWPAMLPKVWPAMEDLNVNTVEMPIYWEQFEPRPGQYDYTTIDTVLTQARQHHVRLVLLWFGTWKNGSQHYMPEWMKLHPTVIRIWWIRTGRRWTRLRLSRPPRWRRTRPPSRLSCDTSRQPTPSAP